MLIFWLNKWCIQASTHYKSFRFLLCLPGDLFPAIRPYFSLIFTHIPLNARAHFSAQMIQAVLLSWCGNHMKDKEATPYDIILCDIYIYHYGRSVRENGTKLSQERDLSQVVSRSTLFSLTTLPPYKVAGSRSSLTRREQAMRKPKFQP